MKKIIDLSQLTPKRANFIRKTLVETYPHVVFNLNDLDELVVLNCAFTTASRIETFARGIIIGMGYAEEE